MSKGSKFAEEIREEQEEKKREEEVTFKYFFVHKCVRRSGAIEICDTEQLAATVSDFSELYLSLVGHLRWLRPVLLSKSIQKLLLICSR